MEVLFSAQNICKQHGTHTLFTGINFSVFAGDHIGVIGRNGSGKSTLLKIIAGLEQADEGQLAIKKHLRIVYVPQEERFETNETIQEYIERHLKKSNSASDHNAQYFQVLKFSEIENTDLPLKSLSGGKLKRLAIATGIAQEPDLLLLDEPTNHLDIANILWLEAQLNQADYAWVAISHDRQFLQNTTKKVAEISKLYADGLLLQNGNYAGFIEGREAFIASQSSYADSLENKYRRELEWLRRGPKARTTKSKARIDEAANLKSELDNLQLRLKKDQQNLGFSSSERQTKKLIEAKKITFSYSEKSLVENLDLALTAGMRLGLLGRNGSGKTTLVKLLLKNLEPQAGTVDHARDLRIVYFDQKRQTLDQNITLQKALVDSGDSVIYQGRSIHIISWAKRFLFTPEQLRQPIHKLSGGEQAKVLLARLMLLPADVLMLDEPSNDLDIETLQIFEDSLLEFSGAIVLISHDRFLLKRVCTHFLGFVDNISCRLYADPDQWEEESKNSHKTNKKNSGINDNKKTDESMQYQQAPISAPVKKINKSKLSYLEQREYDGMEVNIHNAEKALAEAELEFNNPTLASDSQKLMTASENFNQARQKLEALYERWAELEKKI
ncbi:MAG: ABC-F family ATP-binding cassette domain-containing protein [Oligoflexales bacterium]|nr:ABC-F family ATP-binding cassette domain-containing protein [Oligoflexales bacterium]